MPPPLPRPRRRFFSSMKGILQLVRCPTFVRILRRLLSVAVASETPNNLWSETLSELTFYLVIIALYEDAIAFK